MAAPSSGTVIFYAVLIAPGFIAVMTAISLAAIEDELSQFVLLVWSLVTSLVIDTAFISWYQWVYGPITSFEALPGILFQPFFRVDFIAYIFGISVLVGVVGATGILADVAGRGRRMLQRPASVTYSPRQPWANFMRDTKSIQVKTSDDQLFAGELVEWSRAERPKEIRIANPYVYLQEEHDFEPVGKEDMLFLETDIDRITMRTEDNRISISQKIRSWIGRRFG